MENVTHDSPPKQFEWTDKLKNEFATKLINKEYVSRGWSIEAFTENFIKEKIKTDKSIEEKIPTSWLKMEQLKTWIGKTDNGENKKIGGRAKLIILHRCGENKEALICQLQ